MARNRTVDNIGFINYIELDEFPLWTIGRDNMRFLSPSVCTGKPAQADEFWVEGAPPFTDIDLTKIICNYDGDKTKFLIKYSGMASYSNIDGDIKEYRIKCFFYIEKVARGSCETFMRFDGKFMVKVDLYNDWVDEISRFELMEIEE